MLGQNAHFYEFRSFRLNLAERQLLNAGTPVPLTPKAFDILAVLVERAGHLVEKEELMQKVWPDSFVEESNVSRIIHTLRKALGEDQNGNKFIETVAKKGYRFVADVDSFSDTAELKKSAEKSNSEFDFPEILGQTSETIGPSSFPAKEKQVNRIVLISLGFLLAVAFISILSLNFRSTSTETGKTISIAVLPLKPITAENRDAICEIGIADTLINQLGRSKELTVRPLSATRGYVDIDQDAVAAGREQMAAYVLASNYQIANGRIRVTSQLINVKSGSVEETLTFEEGNENIFAAGDAIAARIGQRLFAKFGVEPDHVVAKRGTTNEEAYRLYLHGNTLIAKRNRKDAAKAIETFERAIVLDPNYAEAYAGLGAAHGAASLFGGDNREHYPKQKAAIEKALEIDPNHAEAHGHLGIMKSFFEWDFAGAERELKLALELDPKSSVSHRLYAVHLNSMGRFSEAIAEIKTAIDLEPSSAFNHKDYGMILYFARRYDEAIAQMERTVEMSPGLRVSYGWLISSYRMKGEDGKAFEWFLRSPAVAHDAPEKMQLWKDIYATSGWRGIELWKFEEASREEKNGQANYWELAVLSTNLGDKEKTIHYLEKLFAAGERSWIQTTIKINPQHDHIRSDPRFDELVRRVGLP